MKQKVSSNKCLNIILCMLFGILMMPRVIQAEIASDKAAKFYITSQTAEINKTTGISIFVGNVVIDHGTTHVTADQVTSYTDKNNHIVKAVAVGKGDNLATYQTMTDEKKPPLMAKAKTIQYFPQQHYVVLIGDAYVIQGKDSIAGPQLEYDLTKQLLITKAVNANTTSRTHIVIQPEDVN